MLKSIIVTLNDNAIRRLALASGLVVLLCLVLPATTSAGPPLQAGAEKCAGCHPEETTAWQKSPHAQAAGSQGNLGATCEDCHGSFVENHPEKGTMQLMTDSAVCKDCHTGTFEQWADSRHAQSDVQCIGCHLSHSEKFRLTDNELCGSCHRDRLESFSHTAHGNANITCADCHMETASGAGESGGRHSTPNHNFSSIPPENCAKCHKQTIHEESHRSDVDQETTAWLVAKADRVPKLTAKLEAAEEAKQSLQTQALISLGVGIGGGGMLGIIFVLVVGYMSQKKAQK